ncbi:hypothetical protein VNO78_01702 [Psophocarpus tetragonolobus]|uniref:Uncharacterized protein n=1 Tax=Psophocarpus tetragonolobus TaxID=3891 RepID=A0AAN9XUS3_PSOTE
MVVGVDGCVCMVAWYGQVEGSLQGFAQRLGKQNGYVGVDYVTALLNALLTVCYRIGLLICPYGCLLASFFFAYAVISKLDVFPLEFHNFVIGSLMQLHDFL